MRSSDGADPIEPNENIDARSTAGDRVGYRTSSRSTMA
ncbi:hypothetical protein NJ7G_1461 [Natrinema sp. J7-2]|nr:hypothetical protein NJ7G_1461 [Natrinema sp. J7-2]